MAKQLIRNEDEAISSDEEHEIEPELADVPFGELQKLKSDGTAAFVSRIKSEKKTTGRANKNRPMEVSGMKPIARFREVFQVPKKLLMFMPGVVQCRGSSLWLNGLIGLKWWLGCGCFMAAGCLGFFVRNVGLHVGL